MNFSRKYCAWTKSVRTTLKPWLKPWFVGIYAGESFIPGFLRCYEMDFVHPLYEKFGDLLGPSGSETGQLRSGLFAVFQVLVLTWVRLRVSLSCFPFYG